MRLSNGLDFVAQASASSQVCVQWWLRTATQGQPFKQLAQQLFQGSRYLPEQGFMHWVRRSGGLARALIYPDALALQTSVAAAQLEPLLWAEAERFSHLQIAAAQQADFAARQLRTDRCVLVVSGGFEATALQRWVDYYWGSLRAPREAWQPPPGEPVPQATSPWPVSLSLAVRGAASPDWAGLQLLAALLGQGESSRLHDGLVVRDQSALRAGCRLQFTAAAGLLTLQAEPAPKQTPAQLRQSLQQELLRLAQEPLSEEELGRARAQLLTQALVQRQHPAGLGEQLARGQCWRGDSNAQAQLEADWAGLTVAQVQALAARLLNLGSTKP